MTFRVPSSSPPSTPNPPRQSKLTPHPSTTPAGPPPSSLTGFSTTPAGPPPASSFFVANASQGSAFPFSSTTSTQQNGFNSSPMQPPLGTQNFYDLTEDDFQEDDGSGEIAADDMEISNAGEDAGADLISYSETSEFVARPGTTLQNLQTWAKGMARPTSNDELELDAVILQTERILEDLMQDIERDSSKKEATLSSAVQSLLKVWRASYSLSTRDSGIGPADNDPLPANALFLSSLLLQLHYPPNPTVNSRTYMRSRDDTIPKVLLDWLQNNHFPYQGDLEETLSYEPNPASFERFWDVVYNTTLRGNIQGACDLLHSADLSQAATAIDDGAPHPGYHGKHLHNARAVMERAIQVLEECPAWNSKDWNVTGPAWTIFRKRVRQATSDLQSFAEGKNVDQNADVEENFEAPNFGMSNAASEQSFSQRSRRAESRVPWSIYQSLMYLYAQLLGTPSEVIAASGDWVEAVLGVVVWWSGDDDETQDDFKRGRRSLSRSHMPQDRLVDTHPQLAYLQKLAAFLDDLQDGENRTDEAELQIDPRNAVQVGLGCVLAGDLEGVIRIMRGWAPTIANAVIEVADVGGWLGRASPSQEMMDGFNQSDLMVLSYAQQQQGTPTDHEDALCNYADMLATREQFRDGDVVKQGWQVAVQVLARLHNFQAAAKKISQYLGRLEITDSRQVEQTVSMCHKMGLDDEARKISQRYGDHLAENTNQYGKAIFHYVRSGSTRKIKELLNLLVSLSLVQSIAYPPAKDLDDSMRNLVNTPKQTLARLAILDPGMQATLIRHISGYATVRKYYELRDLEVNKQNNSTTPLKPTARKKEALSSLVALIQSASDGIHGGLLDPSVDSAISVDGLLVLLAETLPFMNHPKSLLTHTQTVTILKALEDLSTVSSTIYSHAEDCFKSAINSFHGSAPPSPRSMLKKSSSNMSASNGFSLVGSDLLGRSRSGESEPSVANSGVLVKGPVRRGWEWRKGVEKEANSREVLEMLRYGLTKEVSRTWLRSDAEGAV